MRLILASSSAQRKKILNELGLKFEILPADIDEHHDGLKKPHAIAKSIARRKAEYIAEKNPDAWVIGCDTLVYLSDGRISVKPNGRKEARDILKSYQNSHCDVYSGLAIMHKNSGRKYLGFERTRIYFNDFSDESLEKYLSTGEWKGRSGAMTIEGKGNWIRKMEGEYWNVVGLPVDLLKKHLKCWQLV